jgi:hypothetical protein
MNHNLLLQFCLLFQRVDSCGQGGKELLGFFLVFATPAARQNPTNDQIDNNDKKNKFHSVPSREKRLQILGILLKL